MMKEWKKPSISNINISKTREESDYINICNWDGAVSLGLGNEEYTDPNNKPEEHPDWVWCYKHKRWHPKDHSKDNNIVLS